MGCEMPELQDAKPEIAFKDAGHGCSLLAHFMEKAECEINQKASIRDGKRKSHAFRRIGPEVFFGNLLPRTSMILNDQNRSVILTRAPID